MDSDLGKKIVRITDSKHNCSRTADLSMAASTDLALKLHGSADPVSPFHPPLNRLIVSGIRTTDVIVHEYSNTVGHVPTAVTTSCVFNIFQYIVKN